MSKLNRRERAIATFLFSAIMGAVSGFAGFLIGGYIRSHFGVQQPDPDDMQSYMWGLFIGGATALSVFAGSLWVFWPRKTSQQERASCRVV